MLDKSYRLAYTQARAHAWLCDRPRLKPDYLINHTVPILYNMKSNFKGSRTLQFILRTPLVKFAKVLREKFPNAGVYIIINDNI